MRRICALLLLASLAGCVDEAEVTTPSEARDEHDPPLLDSYVFPFSAPLAANPGDVPVLDEDQFHQAFAFDVPDEARLIAGEGKWGCISICPLVVTLQDPAGKVVSSKEGGSWYDSVENPAPGTWTLKYTPRDVTVGSQGEFTIRLY